MHREQDILLFNFRFTLRLLPGFQMKIPRPIPPIFCASCARTAPLSSPRFVNNRLTQSDICHFLLLHKDEKMW